MSEIRYAAASLINPTSPERRTLNVDFTIGTSNKFNKIKLPLTSRSREYLPNISEEELQAWPKHLDIIKEHKDQECPSWIGKIHERGKFNPQKVIRSHRLENTGALLIYNSDKNIYNLKCWIEDWNFEITLYPTGDEKYPYKGSFLNSAMPSPSKKGVWV